MCNDNGILATRQPGNPATRLDSSEASFRQQGLGATSFLSNHSLCNLAGLLSSIILLACSNLAFASGHWQGLNHQPRFLNPPSLCTQYPTSANCAADGSFSYGGVTQPLLLTDGSVLFASIAVDDNGVTTEPIYKLTPDKY